MKITSFNQSPLPYSLFDSATVREIERALIQSGCSGFALMQAAAVAVAESIRARYSDARAARVYCGSGNNGGDGYLVAALLSSDRRIEIIECGNISRLSGDAQRARDEAVRAQVVIKPFSADLDKDPAVDLIVDAVLGIGLNGTPRPVTIEVIEQINRSGVPVVAVDVPSGLSADTGAVVHSAVKASLTVTFIGIKPGLMSGRGPALCGELVFADLGATDISTQNDIKRLEWADQVSRLSPRAADAHKGDFGHVMIIGGDAGHGGAAIMAAEAAARVGAGLVSLATRPEHVAAMLARRPEVMTFGVVSGQELEPLLAKPTVIVIGPGLGRSPWSEQMLQQAMKTGLPMIVDADALNIMAAGRVVTKGTRRDNWILTPHPGEAARLLDCNTAYIQQNRFEQAIALQQRYGGSVILKGAGSLVIDADNNIGVVTGGNPGMASGGMGDVLSGILGGLLAQGIGIADTARMGVCLHAEAADLAVEQTGERSLLATDLLPWVCELLNDH